MRTRVPKGRFAPWRLRVKAGIIAVRFICLPLRRRKHREHRSPTNRPRRQRKGRHQAADHRLRYPSEKFAGGFAALSEQSLVGLRDDLRRALAPRLRQGLPLSQGSAAGFAPGLLAARRRLASEQLRIHAQAASRFLRHRIRRDESAVAVRAGRAERRIQRSARVRRQRIPDQPLECARSAAEGLADRALRGSRSLA